MSWSTLGYLTETANRLCANILQQHNYILSIQVRCLEQKFKTFLKNDCISLTRVNTRKHPIPCLVLTITAQKHAGYFN